MDGFTLTTRNDEPTPVDNYGYFIRSREEWEQFCAIVSAYYDAHTDKEIEEENLRIDFLSSTWNHTDAVGKGIGYLYIMKSGDLRKIGISKDPRRRATDISRKEGQSASLEKKWKVRRRGRLESFVHHRFRHKRIRREWFRLDDEDLDEIEWLISLLGLAV